ncbi:MAG: hypothetical protein AB7F09_29290 [Parvibaculaceae bacterium]
MARDDHPSHLHLVAEHAHVHPAPTIHSILLMGLGQRLVFAAAASAVIIAMTVLVIRL